MKKSIFIALLALTSCGETTKERLNREINEQLKAERAKADSIIESFDAKIDSSKEEQIKHLNNAINLK